MDVGRRQLLKTGGMLFVAGLAGCSGDNDNSSTSTSTQTSTEVQYDSQIQFLQTDNIQTVPIVNDDTIEDVAAIQLKVENQNGLKHISVNYNDKHRDQPFSLYDEGVDGQTASIAEEFPQRILAPQTGEFTVETTDVNGNTSTQTEPIEGLSNRYQADRKRTGTGNIGNYTTERNWDNLNTNTEEINQIQQEWLNQESYKPLVDRVMQGGDLSNVTKVFPNWEGDNDRGYFDQEAVKNEDNFETLLRWYLPAIMHYDRENYGSAPSSRNSNFAATMETLLNEHHPTAEAQATNINSLPAHGIFGIQDKNNEEFYLVDTTSPAQYEQAVGRIGDFITSKDGSRSELWDPFHDFQTGLVEFPNYLTKSEQGMAGLINFVDSKRANQEYTYDQIFITDEWLQEGYEVLRNGGSIDSITAPIEEMIYQAVKSENGDEKIGIYGTLDDTRIAVDSGDEIYNQVMHEPEPQGIQEIESLLEAA